MILNYSRQQDGTISMKFEEAKSSKLGLHVTCRTFRINQVTAYINDLRMRNTNVAWNIEMKWMDTHAKRT